MPAPAANRAVADFLRRTTMQSILGLDQGALDHVMATAYQLYQAGRYPEVDVLCRGLIAADHTYWWSYSLRTRRRSGAWAASPRRSSKSTTASSSNRASPSSCSCAARSSRRSANGRSAPRASRRQPRCRAPALRSQP